jgi:hypothetical protein
MPSSLIIYLTTTGRIAIRLIALYSKTSIYYFQLSARELNLYCVDYVGVKLPYLVSFGAPTAGAKTSS